MAKAISRSYSCGGPEKKRCGKTCLPRPDRDRPETLHDLAEIPVVAVTSEIGDLRGIVEEEEFCLFSDPEDAILVVEAQAELTESAGASALPAGASTDGAASSSDAAILADGPASDKSDADLWNKVIDADLLRKAAS